jgi:hypothetical protein
MKAVDTQRGSAATDKDAREHAKDAKAVHEIERLSLFLLTGYTGFIKDAKKNVILECLPARPQRCIVCFFSF